MVKSPPKNYQKTTGGVYMENNDKVINLKAKRGVGRPKLTDEEKKAREEQKEFKKSIKIR